MFHSQLLLELTAKEALNLRLDEAARQRLFNQSGLKRKTSLVQMVQRFLSTLTKRASKARLAKRSSVTLQTRTQK